MNRATSMNSAQPALRLVAVAALTSGAFAAQAAEYAHVISSTPVAAQVAVPQNVCRDEQRLYRPPTTGAGALVGAIAGGLIGHAFGSGGGRVAATGVGAVLGSAVGNNVEANGYPPGEATVRRCQTVSSVENRTVGYDVVYEYAGRRYATRLANDPGNEIEIDVRPAGAAQPPQAAYVDPGPAPAPVYAPAYGPVYRPVPAVVVAPYVGWGPRYRPGWY